MQCNLQRILLNLILFASICILFYVIQDSQSQSDLKQQDFLSNVQNVSQEFNLWCIYTKADKNYRLQENFRRFVKSVVVLSTVQVSFNVISDNNSISLAQNTFSILKVVANAPFSVHYYDIEMLADSLTDIVHTMQQHFSSQPGSYYSDALFFLSLGLHKVSAQSNAIMIDIDTELRVDIRNLFEEFNNMPKGALVAAAPEQSPVYRHTLHMYRAAHRETKFGNPVASGGNPGLNSGVLLLNLAGQRQSKLYQNLLTKRRVSELCAKYQFHGHLGDQDWYTLVSHAYPSLIHFLDCTWNRQLCLWWRHHGYHDVFDLFHYCPGPARIYHGNCNTPIPSS